MLHKKIYVALTIGNGSFMVFFTTPIGTTFIGLSTVIIAATVIGRARKSSG